MSKRTRLTDKITGEIAATEYNNGVGIDWGNTHFSLYPWWLGSVAEAVFLLGAERNADKIIGTTYVSFDLSLWPLSKD
jgi:alpha-N-arabinofuranosidase